jgi:ribosomal protein L37E
LKFRALGFGWLSGKPFGTGQPFGNTKAVPLVPWLNSPPYNAVVLPYWFVILLLAGPWWWLALRPLLARLRTQPGTCRRCGYDLRATPHRCPECGFVPAPRKRVAPRNEATPSPYN